MKARVLFALCSLIAFVALADPPPLGASRERAVQPAVTQSIVVTFSGQIVHIAGITPNGSVAIMAAMRELYRTTVIKMTNTEKILTDTAGTGAVDFDLGRAIPLRSIWAVVDMTSGQATLASPAGFPLRAFSLPATLARNGRSNDDDQIVGNRLLLDILFVRPGKNGGAWFQRTSDGGETDEDAKNDGQTLCSLSGFIAVDRRNDPPPRRLQRDDVLVFIDPMEMMAAKVTQ